MCLMCFLGNYDCTTISDKVATILHKGAVFFDMEDSPKSLAQMMTKFEDTDSLIDVVLTIDSYKAKKFILANCYDLMAIEDKEDSKLILYDISKKMGYKGIAPDLFSFMYKLKEKYE